MLTALASGCFFAAAAPPTNAYAALWLGLAGLAFVGERAFAAGTGLRHAAALGLAFGAGANIVALRFVPDVIARFTTAGTAAGWVALVLLGLAQGVRWGAAAATQTLLRKRGAPLPLAFATGMMVATFVPAVFPWTPAGGVTPIPQLVQLAELVGERGVTVLMAVAAGLLAQASVDVTAASRRSVQAFVAALAIPLLTFMEGEVRLKQVEAARPDAPTVRVALVHPSVPTHDRWDPSHASHILAKLTTLTADAERQGAELTVWPEAAYPFAVGHASRRCPIGSNAILPFGVRGPVLTGLVMSGGDGDIWNAAAVCRTDGVLSAPQDKIHLLWFGETIPGLDRIPWVRAKFTRGIGIVGGKDVVIQNAGRARAAVLNCFEDTLADAGRDAMAKNPNVLVNVTNDGWFEGSAESELHLRLSALRAVESRRDLVRAVNLGVTSWIDAAGVVRARTTDTSAGAMLADAALFETPITPFDRFGDVPLVGLLALANLAAIAAARRATLTGSGPSTS